MGSIDRQISETGDGKSLSAYLHKIDTLTAQSELEQTEQLKTITRRHLKDKESHKLCSNRQCRKGFSFIERPHHCYRCGEVFCSSCLQYRRKLSQLAQPDPDGKPYRVCQSCYEEGRVVEGRTRQRTEEFKWLRMTIRLNQSGTQQNELSKSRWSRFNLDAECGRLIRGFQDQINASEVKRTLQEMRDMVSIPDWQKSSTWLQESLAESCQFCCSKFGLLRKKCFCKVCGKAVCKTCSNKDLLVYIPDDHDEEHLPQPKLAIIKIVGAPEVEPEVSLHMRVCSVCREQLIDRQVLRREEIEDTGSDFLSKLKNIHHRFGKTEHKIKQHLPAYQEIVESLEDNSRKSTEDPQKSNMKTLAKAQSDLADYLAEFVVNIQLLKKLQHETNTQALLLRNYIKSKCDFYMDNMFNFRNMRRKLSESSPPEVLELIQSIMDRNAIISAHVYLLQLVYETIHLCDRHSLDDTLPRTLAPIEEVVKKDVQVRLLKDKENWDQHQTVLNEMIKCQLKDHRLIRPSRTSLKRYGSKHVEEIMKLRTREILHQIDMQLKLKSAHRCFSATKRALEKALEDLPA